MPDGDRRHRLLELGQGVLPVLLLGQRHGGHRVGDVLDERSGPRSRPWFSARSLITRAEPNSAYLCETILANRGVELTDDPGVAVERAVGLAAPGALVDVPLDGGDAVGGLVLLEELALAGQLGVADLDRRAVGVEPLEGLGGGEDAGLVEALLDGLLGVEHRGAVGDLDLDGEGGVGAGDDGGGHGDLPVEGSNLPKTPDVTLFRGHTRCQSARQQLSGCETIVCGIVLTEAGLPANLSLAFPWEATRPDSPARDCPSCHVSSTYSSASQATRLN